MRILGPILLSATSVCLALIAGEILVRSTGHQPWSRLPRFDGIPTVTEPDSELGWKNKPGHYHFGATPESKVVEVTIDQDGIRKVPTFNTLGQQDAIWAMGCSLTYGWGVADDETYTAAAALELSGTERDKRQLVNLGVAGYGTLQTWRLFQRRVEQAKPPRLVLYGYFSGHAERNLALPNFTRTLDRAASQQAWVTMPFARLDSSGKKLEFHPPTGYKRWPGAEHSALINLAQESADEVERRRLSPSMYKITRELIRQFASNARAKGSDFVVLLLYVSDEDIGLREELAQAGIAFLDLTNMGYPSPSTAIEGDGHPNAAMHALWGRRIAKYLDERLVQGSMPVSR